MSRLKKNASDIEKQYFVMCEAVAYDIVNDPDINIDVHELAVETINAIGTQYFLSDFEKTVRDYFREKNMPLDSTILFNDISKFM